MVRCFVGDMGRRTGRPRQGVPPITLLDPAGRLICSGDLGGLRSAGILAVRMVGLSAQEGFRRDLAVARLDPPSYFHPAGIVDVQ